MNRTIRNWTDATELEVKTLATNDEIPSIVLITADAGPLHLHFGMTAGQARAMAKTLIEAAHEIEAVQVAA